MAARSNKRRRGASQAVRKDSRAPRRLRLDRRVLGGVAALVLLAGVGWGVWLTRSPEVFPIRSIQVAGDLRHVDAARIRAKVSAHIRDNFFYQDIDAIRADLQGLAWVDRVTVRRIWPDTLRLTLVEQRPLAVWRAGGMINQRGEWFAGRDPALARKLPVLAGPRELAGELARRYRDYRPRLAALGLELGSLAVNARRAWTLTTREGMVIRLGRRHVARRLARFERSYRLVLAQRRGEIAAVDMRYTNGFAVDWKKTSQVSEANLAQRPGVRGKS